MADPTKGPWQLSDVQDGYRYVSGKGWGSFARVVVAITEDGVIDVPSPEGEANARLISLAPEMADLLREMENYPECFICKRDPDDGHDPACRLGNLLKRMEG